MSKFVQNVSNVHFNTDQTQCLLDNLNPLETFRRIDDYLMSASYRLSVSGHSVCAGHDLDDPYADLGIAGAMMACLANIPAALISAVSTVTSVVKLSFEILAKLSLGMVGFCGSLKARELSHSINLTFTAQKTGVYALGLILHAVAIPFICPPLGVFSHWVNMKLWEALGAKMC